MRRDNTIAYEMTTQFIDDVVGRRSHIPKAYYTTKDKIVIFHPVYIKVDERVAEGLPKNNFYQIFEFMGYVVEAENNSTFFINEEGFKMALKQKIMFELGELG
jgi:hypothetical protein